MLVDGNKIAKKLEAELVRELGALSSKKVCFIILGGNVATEQFVKVKSRVAERLGIVVTVKRYTEAVGTEEAALLVREVAKEGYDGIVVQLPLFPEIAAQIVLDEVPADKDIDVLSTRAKELYMQGISNKVPPVAQAVYEVLQACHTDLPCKQIVVLGGGRLVGEPVHLMFQRMSMPHHVIDIETSEEEKKELLKTADIIVSGIGVPHAVTPEMIKNGVVLIDAGTSELAGNFVGDIDPACEGKASHLTPVPGGIGPITIVSLLRNLL